MYGMDSQTLLNNRCMAFYQITLWSLPATPRGTQASAVQMEIVLFTDNDFQPTNEYSQGIHWLEKPAAGGPKSGNINYGGLMINQVIQQKCGYF